jgi:hypothetical protein
VADADDGTSFLAKLRIDDRPFLDAERLRLIRASFLEDSRFSNLGIGELISRLLEELRQLRRAALVCECGACDGIVDPDATLEDPAQGKANGSE